MKTERITLSTIELEVSSIPPPPAPLRSNGGTEEETERLWEAIRALDRTTRAHALSYRTDRTVNQIRAWAILIAATGGAIASIINALR